MKGTYRATLACAVVLCALVLPRTVHAATAGWSLETAPTPGASEDSRLHGIACLDDVDCWAVGSYFNGTGYRTLVEQHAAGGWVIVHSPNASNMPVTNSSQDNVLNAITCVSGTCWAVGYWYDGTNNAQSLIEENSGGGWTIVASPNLVPVVNDYLNAVTCASPSDCWAVGSTLVPGTFFIPNLPIPGTPAQTFIVHYDGSSWSLVTSPNNNASENALYGVGCSSVSDCWAVGIYFNNGQYDTLVEENTGSGWSIVNAPNAPGSQENLLDGISCAGPQWCASVGLESPPGGPTQTLLEENSGGGWAIESGANTSTSRLNALSGVECSSAGSCWAVGADDSNGQFLFQTLIEQRTPSGWTIVPSPDTASDQPNVLDSVTCTSNGGCWAVGYDYADPSTPQPLIVRYAPTVGAAVPDLGSPLVAASAALLAAAAGGLRRRGLRSTQKLSRPAR